MHKCTRWEEIQAAKGDPDPTPSIPGTLHAPAKLLEEIEPVIRPHDGRKLRRWRWIGTDKTFTEDPMDYCPQVPVTAVGPMPRPKAIFYLDYKYPTEPTEAEPPSLGDMLRALPYEYSSSEPKKEPESK
jgi:hypothetical protein